MDKMIGQRLSQARKIHNLTQEDLAELSGLSVSAISRIETGQNSTSLKNLCKFCDILNINLDYLLYDLLPHNYSMPDPTSQDILFMLNKLDDPTKQFVIKLLSLYIQEFNIS